MLAEFGFLIPFQMIEVYFNKCVSQSKPLSTGNKHERQETKRVYP
jgi:hypothetical protein